jgi:membrane protease YdiL (CAAX protease family)
MLSPMITALLKVALPLAAVGAVLFFSKKKGLSWEDVLGFKKPRIASASGWLALWVVVIFAEEFIIRKFGMEQAKRWPEMPLSLLILKILALGFAGPLAEETIMRGMALGRLSRTRLGEFGAIAVCAAAWAAMHFNYGAATVAMIAFDGVILGLARTRGGSLWIPIMMHMLGNCLSVVQSLTGM